MKKQQSIHRRTSFSGFKLTKKLHLTTLFRKQSMEREVQCNSEQTGTVRFQSESLSDFSQVTWKEIESLMSTERSGSMDLIKCYQLAKTPISPKAIKLLGDERLFPLKAQKLLGLCDTQTEQQRTEYLRKKKSCEQKLWKEIERNRRRMKQEQRSCFPTCRRHIANHFSSFSPSSSVSRETSDLVIESY